MLIQLADHCLVHPIGVLEDLLVQVKNLVFLADFFIMEIESEGAQMILVGRSFLKTSRTKIDVHSGSMTMEFDSETVTFNIYDAMKYPDMETNISMMDIIEPFEQEVCQTIHQDRLKITLEEGLDSQEYL